MNASNNINSFENQAATIQKQLGDLANNPTILKELRSKLAQASNLNPNSQVPTGDTTSAAMLQMMALMTGDARISGSAVDPRLARAFREAIANFQAANPAELAKAFSGNPTLEKDNPEAFKAAVETIKRLQSDPDQLDVSRVSVAKSQTSSLEGHQAAGEKDVLPTNVNGLYANGQALVSEKLVNSGDPAVVAKVVTEEAVGEPLKAELKATVGAGTLNDSGASLAAVIGGASADKAIAAEQASVNELARTEALVDGKVVTGEASAAINGSTTIEDYYTAGNRRNFMNFYNKMFGGTSNGEDNAFGFITKAWDDTKDFAKKSYKDVEGGLDKTGKFITGAVEKVAQLVSSPTEDAAKAAYKKMEGPAKKIYDGLSDGGKVVAVRIGQIIEDGLNQGVYIANALEQGVKQGKTTIYDAVKFVADHVGAAEAEILLKAMLSRIASPAFNFIEKQKDKMIDGMRQNGQKILDGMDKIAKASTLDLQEFNGEGRVGSGISSIHVPILPTGKEGQPEVDESGQMLADVLNTPKVASALRQQASIFGENADTLQDEYLKQVYGDGVTAEQAEKIGTIFTTMADAVSDGPVTAEQALALSKEVGFDFGSFGSGTVPAGGLFMDRLGDQEQIMLGDHVLAHTTAATGKTDTYQQNTLASIFLEELTHHAANKSGTEDLFEPTNGEVGDLGRRGVNFVTLSGLNMTDPEDVKVPNAEEVRTYRGAARNDVIHLDDGTEAQAGFFAQAGEHNRLFLQFDWNFPTPIPGLSVTAGGGANVDIYGVQKSKGRQLEDFGTLTHKEQRDAVVETFNQGEFNIYVQGEVGFGAGSEMGSVWGGETLQLSYSNNGDWGKNGSHALSFYNNPNHDVTADLFGLGQIGVGNQFGGLFNVNASFNRDEFLGGEVAIGGYNQFQEDHGKTFGGETTGKGSGLTYGAQQLGYGVVGYRSKHPIKDGIRLFGHN